MRSVCRGSVRCAIALSAMPHKPRGGAVRASWRAPKMANNGDGCKVANCLCWALLALSRAMQAPGPSKGSRARAFKCSASTTCRTRVAARLMDPLGGRCEHFFGVRTTQVAGACCWLYRPTRQLLATDQAFRREVWTFSRGKHCLYLLCVRDARHHGRQALSAAQSHQLGPTVVGHSGQPAEARAGYGAQAAKRPTRCQTRAGIKAAHLAGSPRAPRGR